jgi:competence protein ComFC
MVPLAAPVCPACKLFSLRGTTHSSCKRDMFLDGAIAVFTYKGVIKKAIIKLKYSFVFDISQELSAYIVSALLTRQDLLQNAVFVPIPLHKKRLKWRGFNQAELLAMGLSRRVDLPVVKLLTRVEDGVQQAELDRKSRLRNMSGKYAVINKKLYDSRGKKVILIDDVWTTGSTLNEAARVLKKAGVKEVWGVTLAR